MSNGSTREPTAPRTSPDLSGLPLLVLTLGAALFALAAWAPWWVYISSVPAVPVYQFNPGYASNVAPLRFLPPVWVLPIWSAVSVLGVLLAGLLWIRRPPRFTHIMLASVALWAVLVTVITVAFWQFVVTGGSPPHPASRYIWHGLHPRYPAYGFWLALGALVLIWTGMLTLVRARRRRTAPEATG